MTTKSEEGKVIFRADLLFGGACAPKGMSREDVEEACNQDSPTGTRSRWRISKKRKLPDGTKLPAPCLDEPSRVHYMLEC